jgi:hypothetical protein
MLNIFKSATVATVADPKTETLVSEFIANGGEITKVTTTAKKKSRKGAKAAETTPVAETTKPSWGDYKDTAAAPVAPIEVTPVVVAPIEAPKNIWGLAIAPAVETTIPAKKSATSTAAARKAALAAEGDKAGRLERVIALLSRPEGASLQDIQTCYWLAAAAVRKIVEKAGYTTSQSGDRGAYRYHARKI